MIKNLCYQLSILNIWNIFHIHFYTKLLLEDLEYVNMDRFIIILFDTLARYMREIVRKYDIKRRFANWNFQFGETLVKPQPLSILTATVVHVVAFSMPKAAASTTCPNAPRPSGSPWMKPESKYHQQNILCRYNFRIVFRMAQDTLLLSSHPAWVCLSETPICWHHRWGVRIARPWACPPSPGSWTGSLFSNLHHWTGRER